MDKPILTHPNKILRIVCQPIAISDIDELAETLMASFTRSKTPAVGLAANQIGIDAAAFVYDAGNGPRFIGNATVLGRSTETHAQNEGCLSLPGIRINKKRATSIELEHLNFSGETVTKTYHDWEARIIQHELDHLAGKLILERKRKR